MRVALVSDAHGNAVGLQAALDDIGRRGADRVVALGDMAAQGGPESFDAWASYAIVEPASVEFHRVPFDLDELGAVMRASGMPRAEEVSARYRRL